MIQFLRLSLLAGALGACLAGQPGLSPEPVTAQSLAAELRQITLDPETCVHVRDVELKREEVRFYFTDGYLAFAKPVRGRRVFMIFVAPDSGGDAEVLLRPPNAGERLSLASFTDSPNLNEHFRFAIFIFTDSTYEELRGRLAEAGTPNLELGMLLADQYGGTMRNLGHSFSIRLVQDLLSDSPPDGGVFFATMGSTRLGNFDVVVDPRMQEQILVGQLNERDGPVAYNIWASFESRAAIARHAAKVESVEALRYRIEATLTPELNLDATTRITIRATQRTGRSLALQIAAGTAISSITLDGAPAEIFRRDALREQLIRGAGNETVLAVLPRPLEPGREYQLEVHHNGRIGHASGDRVFFVAARTNWYPTFGLQFSQYDLTFRAPKDLDLVATGELIDERIDGDWKVTHRRTSAPVRVAGFNLGVYQRTVVKRGPYTVEVFANKAPEEGLKPQPGHAVILPPEVGRPSSSSRHAGADVLNVPAPPPPNPAARLAALGADISSAFEWMASVFGPPPLNSLTVTPIPASFGQGFPGLIYLSTLAFLREQDRPSYARTGPIRLFYSEILSAHETAHQWWGNLIVASSYHDEWINEAMANYAALMVMERKKGARVLDQILEEYATNLRSPGADGKPVDSAGPITWGIRLNADQRAFRTITYDKGSWIIHMLRRRMGDESFLQFLGALRRRFEKEPITTLTFREMAVSFLPKSDPDPQLDGFFDQWVYSTGIPTLSLSTSAHGSAPNVLLSLKLTQTDATDDCSVDVPVEIRVQGQKPIVKWMRSASEPVTVTVPLKRSPMKVEFAPGNAVLAIRK